MKQFFGTQDVMDQVLVFKSFAFVKNEKCFDSDGRCHNQAKINGLYSFIKALSENKNSGFKCY